MNKASVYINGGLSNVGKALIQTQKVEAWVSRLLMRKTVVSTSKKYLERHKSQPRGEVFPKTPQILSGGSFGYDINGKFVHKTIYGQRIDFKVRRLEHR